MTAHHPPTLDTVPTSAGPDTTEPATPPAPPDVPAHLLVGIAVGILLVEYRSTPPRALELLIDVATHAGRSLPDQARWVVEHHRATTTVHAAGTRRHARPTT